MKRGMKMEPLYYQTPYVKEFDAIVTACRPAKHGFEVELPKPDFTRRAADSRMIRESSAGRM